MPTDFDLTFATGDVVEADHVKQFGVPIQNAEQGQVWYGAATKSVGMSSDDYAVTINSSVSGFTPTLEAGLMVHFKVDAANTQPVTLDVNGLGAADVKKAVSQSLEAGDLATGQMVAVIYDGSNFQLLSGAGALIHASDLPSGIDAAKIGAGSVSNTEFGYLDGVTSSIQTQIDGVAASVPSDTDDLDEGSTNLYFTDARAVTAVLSAENAAALRYRMQATVDGKSTGSTLLGTVPTGKTFIPSDIYIVDTGGISGSGTRPTLKIGSDGSHTNIRSAAQWGPSTAGNYQSLAASSFSTHASTASIYCEVTSAATYSSYTVTVTLLGELY